MARCQTRTQPTIPRRHASALCAPLGPERIDPETSLVRRYCASRGSTVASARRDTNSSDLHSMRAPAKDPNPDPRYPTWGNRVADGLGPGQAYGGARCLRWRVRIAANLAADRIDALGTGPGVPRPGWFPCLRKRDHA